MKFSELNVSDSDIVAITDGELIDVNYWEGRSVEHSPKNGEQRVVPIFSERFLKVLEEYKESLHEMERDRDEELVFMTEKDRPLYDQAFGKKTEEDEGKASGDTDRNARPRNQTHIYQYHDKQEEREPGVCSKDTGA